MPLEYFERDAETADIIKALRRDGAAIVRNHVDGDECVDTLLFLFTPAAYRPEAEFRIRQ